jgi:hypothetical protein
MGFCVPAIVTMASMEEVIGLLKKMDGSQHVFKLDDRSRNKLIEIEVNVKASLGITCRNIGVEECLKRDHVVVVIKDKRFRPPPEPTVLLVADEDTIIGKEIFPNEREQYKKDENVMFLSEDFIVFMDKKPKSKECFLMPPVSFPEIAALPGTKNVTSCSPSPPGDMFVRAMHNLPDDPLLASILIGYDDVN